VTGATACFKMIRIRALFAGGMDISPWQIGIFCHNEQERIRACIESVDRAARSADAVIHVFLNGSTDGSLAALRNAASRSPVVIHEIRAACKSSAINLFLHTICGPDLQADAVICVDGNVIVDEDALIHLHAALAREPSAMAASGTARTGRSYAASARANAAEGGHICGSLFALRPDFVRRMVQQDIRLPEGLYRGDGLLGRFARSDLDWQGTELPSRIVGVLEATFQSYSLSARRPSHLVRQLKRKTRQIRGLIENAAIREHATRLPFRRLPANAYDMMHAYLQEHPKPRVGLADMPFMLAALWQVFMRRSRTRLRGRTFGARK
jgi:glycosyltransferase involved in cell wall biosynthesis